MGEGSAGPDRRLLAAFYTQYVALLLILITYTVGLIAGAPITAPHVATTRPVTQEVTPSPQRGATSLGVFNLSNIFLDDGRVAPENSELTAIAAVLRAHDVSAVVRVSVPRLGVPDENSSFRRALRRVESLETFFAEHRVPEQAFRVIIGPSARSSRDIEVELQEVGSTYEG